MRFPLLLLAAFSQGAFAQCRNNQVSVEGECWNCPDGAFALENQCFAFSQPLDSEFSWDDFFRDLFGETTTSSLGIFLESTMIPRDLFASTCNDVDYFESANPYLPSVHIEYFYQRGA
jgi:hypothetical protein